jgi:hypothetical protein
MAEQAALAGSKAKTIGVACLAAWVLLWACAAEKPQPWPVYEPPEEPRLDPGLSFPSDLGDEGVVPRAIDYPGPGGARPWLTADGPLAPAPQTRSALAEARAAGRRLLASISADVDRDGRPESVALYAGPGSEHVLEVHSPHEDAVLSARRFAPILHDGRRCHLEVRLLGTLRSSEGELPLLWRDRGVGCGAFEGGGYERHLIVEVPRRGEPVEIPVASMRYVEAGAVDAYEAAVWRIASGGGAEVLLVRGIHWARRSCQHPDAGFWVEELAYRRLEPDGSFSAWRDGRTLPLRSGVLPPELLRSRMAPCR